VACIATFYFLRPDFTPSILQASKGCPEDNQEASWK